MTHDVRAAFMAGFPARAREFLVHAAYAACHNANRETKDRFSREHRCDLIPALRRAHFQQACSEIAIRGVKVSVLRNDGETSHFVQLETEDVVLVALTRSRLRPELPVANYRSTRARPSQLVLNGLDLGRQEPQPVDSGAKLFAVCVFGAAPLLPEPSLCEIVFPLPDGSLHPRTINLLRAESAAVVAARRRFGFEAAPTKRETVIIPEAKPRLRKRDGDGE